MHRSLVVAVIICAATFAPRGADAQAITGVVRDAASGAPLPGAVVLSLDSARNTIARVMSNGAGRYLLPVGVASRFVRVLRIGYQPRVLPIDPSARTLDVAMTRLATMLSAVEVSSERVCAPDKNRASALSLWQQARAGLLASSITRESNPANAVVVQYVRSVDGENQRVLRQRIHIRSGITSRPFAVPESAQVLAQRGYFLEAGAERQFVGLDEDVMLDASFGVTHCFGVTMKNATPGEIGLSFEPVRGREDMVDVRGILWLDTRTPELRSIEYYYVGGVMTNTNWPRGVIEFKTMPSGMVFVHTWRVTVPHQARLRVTKGGNVVYQASEGGGFVTSAEWKDGSHWEAPLPALLGTVTDAVIHTPMRGAIITVPATGDSIQSDLGGAFTFTPIIPGRYRLFAEDSAFFGYAVPFQDVDVDVGRRSDVTVALKYPGRDEMLRRICGGVLPKPSTAVVLGRLVLEEGARLPDGVSLTATALGDGGGIEASVLLSLNRDGAGVVPDHDGRFPICGAPRGSMTRITVSWQGYPLRDTLVTPDTSNSTVRVNWHIETRDFERFISAMSAVRGTITHDGTGAPIAGAEVLLPTLMRSAVTDSSGAFLLDSLPPGPTAVQVRHIGFEPRRDTVTLDAAYNRRRDFALRAQGTKLDTLRTIARSRDVKSPGLRGFEDRMLHHASGYFVPESLLRKHDQQGLASVILSSTGGLRIVPGSAGIAYLASGRANCNARGGNCVPCYVTVYMDGLLVYQQDPRRDNDPNTRRDPFDFSRINVADLAGVEFYASSSTAPPQYFKVGQQCGTLLLWSRGSLR